MLQSSVSSSDPHTLPPCAVFVVMPRLRVRMPAPQVTEQGPNGPHWVMTQSMGHAASLQRRVSVRCAHAAPPAETGTRVERVRACVPAPHDKVHALHVLQLDSAQSRGHACVLQLRCWAWGHCVPPKLDGVMTVTSRFCQPVPHERSHAVHGKNELTQ